MPFSQKSFREINRLKIYGSIPNDQVYKDYYKDLGVYPGEFTEIFSAYTSSGFSMSAATKGQIPPLPGADGIKKMQSGAKQGGVVSTASSILDWVTIGVGVAAAATGRAPAFDYPRRYTYQGTEPLNWSVTTYLPLEDPNHPEKNGLDAINNNINFPIRRLFGLYLPTPSDDILKSSEHENDAWWLKGAKMIGNSLGSYVGDVRFLNVPFPYNFNEGSNSRKLIFRLGGMRVDEVVISGVSLTVPPYTFENGLPSHVVVTIAFQTLRPLTTKTFGGNPFTLNREEMTR